MYEKEQIKQLTIRNMPVGESKIVFCGEWPLFVFNESVPDAWVQKLVDIWNGSLVDIQTMKAEAIVGKILDDLDSPDLVAHFSNEEVTKLENDLVKYFSMMQDLNRGMRERIRVVILQYSDHKECCAMKLLGGDEVCDCGFSQLVEYYAGLGV